MSCLANGHVTFAAVAAAAALKGPGDKGVNCTADETADCVPEKWACGGAGERRHCLQELENKVSSIYGILDSSSRGKKCPYLIVGLGVKRKDREWRQLDLEFWKLGRWPILGVQLKGGKCSPPLSPFFILHVKNCASP